jgi:hypothetical protein
MPDLRTSIATALRLTQPCVNIARNVGLYIGDAAAEEFADVALATIEKAGHVLVPGSLEVLNLDPDEVLVVTVPSEVDPWEAAQVRSTLEEWTNSSGHRAVLVVSHEVTVTVEKETDV